MDFYESLVNAKKYIDALSSHEVTETDVAALNTINFLLNKELTNLIYIDELYNGGNFIKQF